MTIHSISDFNTSSTSHSQYKPLEERFWSKVNKTAPNGCWEWTGCTAQSGYGQLWVGDRMYTAHRISWEMHNRPIPEGDFMGTMCICHHCDNKLCVNPDHLFLGSHAMNMEDKIKKLRHRYGESHGMAKLTEKKVIMIRKLAANKDITQVCIAKMFGVTTSSICGIVKRQSWKHI